MYTVTISERGKAPVKLDFDKPEITIGRVRGNDIVLQKNNVSKRHAKLIVKDRQFIIIDQKSTNGTIVNARKITAPQVVREDDKICIGDFILTLKLLAAMESSAPPPSMPRPSTGPPGAPVEPPRPSGEASSAPAKPPAAPMPPPTPAMPPPSAGPPIGPPPVGPPSIGSPPTAPQPISPPPPGPAIPPISGPPSSPPIGPPSMGSPPNDPQPVTSPPTPAPIPSVPSPPPSVGPPSLAPPPTESEPAGPPPSDPAFETADFPGPPGPAEAEPPSIGLGAAPTPHQPVTLGPGGPPQALTDLAGLSAGPSPELARAQSAGLAITGDKLQPRQTLSGYGPVQKEASPATEATLAEVPAFASPPSLRWVERPPLAGGVKPPTDLSTSFAAAQHEIITKVLEEVRLESMPLNYPPEQADLAEYERQVDRALDMAASDGTLEGVDRHTIMSAITYELVGLGPLEIYLDDETVTDIYVNAPDAVYITQDGSTKRATVAYSDQRTLDLTVRRLLNLAEPLDECLSSVRFADGTQIDVLLPPVAVDGPAITIRKPPAEAKNLDQLVSDQRLSENMVSFLRAAIETRRTILIAGPVGSGKLEFFRALASEIPDGPRIVSVDQSGALELPQKSVVRLASGDLGDITGRTMKYALRLAPERILVTGLGPQNCYDWILGTTFAAMGSIATVAAYGARDALARLESMALATRTLHSTQNIREHLARAVNIVVVLTAVGGLPGRVTKVVEVQGTELDTIRLQDIFYFQTTGDEQGGAFHSTGNIPAFYEELRRQGEEIDLSIFRT